MTGGHMKVFSRRSYIMTEITANIMKSPWLPSAKKFSCAGQHKTFHVGFTLVYIHLVPG
jgi:hypothetical protein